MKRPKRRTKILKRGAIVTLSLAIVIVLIGFTVGPAIVAKRLNPHDRQTFPAVTPAVAALHRSLTIADLHADALLWGRDLAQLADYGHMDLPRLIQGNVAFQVFTVVTKVPTPLKLEGNGNQRDNITKLAILQRWPIAAWFSLKERALHQAQQLRNLEQRSSGQFRMIQTAADLTQYLKQRATQSSIVAGLLGLEGAQALEGKIENLDRLYEAGFRLIGLAHFFDNEVAGSVHGISHAGLTPFGRQVIQRMQERRMIIDLAHASSQTIDDVLQITQSPVLVSHTGVRGTCDNARNLTDRQLQQIAKTGGVIGIGFWETAVCGPDMAAIVRAMRYVADLVGVEHVALGSDFDGSVRLPIDAANLVQITAALKDAGFSEVEIGKIMGLNVMRVLAQILPVNP
jgi:membrane dipeptidase